MFIRRLIYTLIALTFVLLLAGGIVHSTGSSLACPDWPLCFGQVFPAMRGGVLYEHSHRLIASAVGLLTLLVVVVAWRQGDARLKKWSLVGLVLVVVQGVLGGITVLLRLPKVVSIAHLGTSMAFFAWTILMLSLLRDTVEPSAPALMSRRNVGIATGLVYVQLLLGAVVRHHGAALACGLEVLSCGNGFLPEYSLQWIQTTHRLFAMVVTAAVIASTVPVLKAARLAGRTRVRRLALASHILLLLQLLMGVLTIKSAVHTHVTTTHLALGALLWGDMVALYLAMGPRGHRVSVKPAG